MLNRIEELQNLHNKLSDRITMDRMQSEEMGKWRPILISLLTFVLAHFIYFKGTLLGVFYAVQSYVLISFALIMVIWGFIYPIIKVVISNKQSKRVDVNLPMKLLPQAISGGKVIIALTVPLFIALLLASIPLLYSSVNSILSNIQLQHIYVFSLTVFSLLLSLTFLMLNEQIYNKLNSMGATKFLGLIFSDKFLLEKIGYLLTMFVITIFSLVVFFAFLFPHLNILISYQFWVSFVFILLMYLSIVSVYSYLDCKKEISAKINKSLIQYYIVDSYIRKNQDIKIDEFEKLKN